MASGGIGEVRTIYIYNQGNNRYSQGKEEEIVYGLS